MSPCTVLVPLERQASDVWRQSGAEPDVRVGVRTGVVAIRVEDAGVRRVVPVAAAIREPSRIIRPIPGVYLICGLYPASKHFADFIQLFAPNLILPEW